MNIITTKYENLTRMGKSNTRSFDREIVKHSLKKLKNVVLSSLEELLD